VGSKTSGFGQPNVTENGRRGRKGKDGSKNFGLPRDHMLEIHVLARIRTYLEFKGGTSPSVVGKQPGDLNGAPAENKGRTDFDGLRGRWTTLGYQKFTTVREGRRRRGGKRVGGKRKPGPSSPPMEDQGERIAWWGEAGIARIEKPGLAKISCMNAPGADRGGRKRECCQWTGERRESERKQSQQSLEGAIHVEKKEDRSSHEE